MYDFVNGRCYISKLFTYVSTLSVTLIIHFERVLSSIKGTLGDGSWLSMKEISNLDVGK